MIYEVKLVVSVPFKWPSVIQRPERARTIITSGKSGKLLMIQSGLSAPRVLLLFATPKFDQFDSSLYINVSI